MTIEDQVVVTGGTMLGLGKVKPVWLAEIGTRTAESFDGENWFSLPSLSRAKVCTELLKIIIVNIHMCGECTQYEGNHCSTDHTKEFLLRGIFSKNSPPFCE